MSSHTPYDNARTRRGAVLTASDELFIDWGPDLPARYPGGRARVMVANPTTLFVAWETDAPGPERWALEVHFEGREAIALELPGKASDAWFQVPARSRGSVSLARVDGEQRSEVAVLPFATPPDGPSASLDERWGRQGAGGQLVTDVAPVRGARIQDDAGPDAAGGRVGYDAGGHGGSTTPYRGD